jgi:hypothetical protein
MRDDLRLCPHLASIGPGPPPFTLSAEEVLDWYDGPVEAVLRCTRCDACGWLELIDWDPRRTLRVFALAALRAADVALYLRNTARGSCDIARARAEREALEASAGPFERLLALELPGLRVRAAAELEPGFVPPPGAWAERLPAAGDPRWFARLDLDKSPLR